MKIIAVIIIFILFKFSLKAQERIEIEYYDKDSLKTLKSIRAYNKKDVPVYQIYYHRNGLVSSIANWYKGIEIGTWIMYYENGQIKEISRRNFFNDYINLKLKLVVDTDFVNYSETRKYLSFSTLSYKNPIVGDVITYYSNGQIESIKHYKDYKCSHSVSTQIKDGVWKFYDSDGKITYERIYSNGKFIRDKFYW